jgi:hypothetical protein
MISPPDAPRFKALRLVYWIAWASILSGLVLIYVFLARPDPKPAPAASDLLKNLAGVVPLFLSIILRWLVLPRYTDLARALPVFIVGLALAEACGILGIFLGGPYRDDLFVLGVLGVTQYVPLFIAKLLRPAPSNFIPNN